MAKKTVSKEQLESYGKFVVEPSSKQLSEYFLLDDHDLRIIDGLRSDTNKLGLAIQLGTIRFIGLFLSNPTEVPYRVVEYVAEQLQLAPSQFQFYHKDTMRSTISYHVQLIKDQYGYQDFSSVASIMALETWLKNRLLVTNERPTLTFDWLVAKCVSEKIVLPGLTVIERFITKIKDNVEHLILAKLSDLPNPSEITKMMSLLTSASKDSEHKELVYRLEDLRRSLDNDSQKELARGIERVRLFNQFDTSSWNLADIPEGKIHYYARIASDTRVQNIQRMSKDRQVAVLASFIYHYKKVATDELLTIFSQYLHSRFKRVKREEEKDRLRTLNDLDGAANKLMRAMTYFLDESIPDEQLRATIYRQFSREEISESIARVNRLTSDDKDPIAITNILNYYSTIKKFLPDILDLIDFKGTIHGEKIIQLWAFLQKQTSNRITADAYAEMKALLPNRWAKYGERHPKSRMKVIVFSTLEQVLPALKNHDIFLSESIKYSNPLDALFPKDEWALIRQDMAEKMELPITADPLLNELAISLRSSYHSVLDTWETNTLCRIEKVKGKNRLVLKNISKLIETDSLINLRKNVAQLIPRPDVTEVLLEVDKRENYTSCFNHLSDNAPRMKQFDISMNAILLSEACNIGLSPVSKTNVKALTKDRLVWGKHNYLRPETITEANNVIVAAHSQLKLSKYFGNGDIASADGLRFSTPVNSIHSGPNPKYFGFGKGITYYNFVSDQFSGFHGMVVPGTERDSLYVLEGLLEQTSPLNPSQIMTDTGGYSDITFGLFALLGYQFSPRIKDSGSSRLWRMDKEADYGSLNELSRHKINTSLIIKHWDEILNVISSLKLGRVRASDIIKALQRDGRPTSLGRAITEYGRIFKSMHLLRYYSDENYCRQILIQLNRGETRHTLCRVISYGKNGKIYKKYQQGQEEMLGALGLVTNAVIYWNTLYMEAALTKLTEEGYPIVSEDIYHLSPLIHEHINFVGKYNFKSTDEIKNGELRKLNTSFRDQLS